MTKFHPIARHWSRSSTLIIAIWICGTVVGMASLTNYSAAPGEAATAPSLWPATTELPRHLSRPLLIMFVHPRCPCSRASINELARLSARCRDRMDITVLFIEPANRPPDWHQSSIVSMANSIAGVNVIFDRNSRLAATFGATTSGHCLVYDACERLVFSGGITAGRGHEGDSPGSDFVMSVASGQSGSQSRTCAAFGCALSAKPSNPIHRSASYQRERDQ